MLDMDHALSKQEYSSNMHINSILNGRIDISISQSLTDNKIWNADSFGIQNTELFNNLKEDQQDSLIKKLSFDRLEEAYHVEHYGMSFASKMSLMAKNLQEQQLYCVVASEEASHLKMVYALLGEQKKEICTNGFSDFLKEVIYAGDRELLIFIVQVLLEGWGLDHYKILGDTALDKDVQSIFYQIVKDESAHHGSGVVLFNEKDLSHTQINRIVDYMKVFLEMIQVGPASLLSSVEKTINSDLSQNQRETFLREINAEAETQRKMNLIIKLMQHSKASLIMEKLSLK